MTISVLMSVYRVEKAEYLDRALQSVWTDQTLKPNQIVLVEDGPLGSDLLGVIAKWEEELKEVLVILKNETNLGLTKSLNKGIKYIHTDLIARMDSDDISCPDRFRLQHDFLLKNEEIAIVGGKIQEFTLDHNLFIRSFPTNYKDVKKYICKASPLAHPTVMMKTDIFKKIQYNEKYKTSQDIALWFDALANGYNISNLDTITLLFRRSDNMLKRRNKSKAINEFKIYMKGILHIYGICTLVYIYPIMRLLFRFMPHKVVKIIYDGKVRKYVLNS
ncbi:MAG: glycosyltransferase [Bacteroidales bacterium]